MLNVLTVSRCHHKEDNMNCLYRKCTLMLVCISVQSTNAVKLSNSWVADSFIVFRNFTPSAEPDASLPYSWLYPVFRIRAMRRKFTLFFYKGFTISSFSLSSPYFSTLNNKEVRLLNFWLICARLRCVTSLKILKFTVKAVVNLSVSSISMAKRACRI